jgi:hypothetical protein
VTDPGAKSVVLAELRAQLDDDVNSFRLKADGSEEPCWGGRLDSQSPHRRGEKAPLGQA